MPRPSPGSRVGSYEIVELLGAGGMGEVYRARDPRLSRDVAIKILAGGVVSDADRLRRFEQEAQAASQINHPNILVVYDIGSQDGVPYLVSELLEGETLRTTLGRGRVPASSVIDYAVQIARGLQAAHEKGIVHRDLKPENVFVTRDGRVKILDFGLAKLIDLPNRWSMETQTAHLTEPGVVMGTAGYMSPEQVRAEDVDYRSDIFAFGAILHELITGARAFTGQSGADVMSAVLTHEPPDATDLNASTAPALSRIVRRCLAKSRALRFQSAADLAFAIESVSQSTGPMSPSGAANRVARASGHSGRTPWVLAGVCGLAAVVLAIGYFTQPPPADARPYAATVSPPRGSFFGQFVVSPDGRTLAFTDAGAGGNRLWIRSLDTLVTTAQPLPGTEGARNPFWSPDSRSLGFFSDNQLRTIEVAGGAPHALWEVTSNDRGGTWNQDGVILFTPNLLGPIYRVLATGGAATAVTSLDSARQESTHRWPFFLPDGRHFVYFTRSNLPERVGLYVGSIDSTTSAFIGPASSNAIFVSPGVLLFVRDGALLSQRFDVDALKLAGDPTTLVPEVGLSLIYNRGSFAASNTGVLVYGGTELSRPVWFDRLGRKVGEVGQPGSYSNLSLSPDEAELTLEKPDPRTGANDVFVIDTRRNISRRFTTYAGSDFRATWRGNGEIIWASFRSGVYDLYRKHARDQGDEELLLASKESKYPNDGSTDGRFLIYESVGRKTSLRALSLIDKTTFALLESGFNEGQAQISPDGRWIAYTTDKDGTLEVYVVNAAAVMPGPGQTVSPRRGSAPGIRVSPNGGAQPQWSRSRSKAELFYLGPDRRLMSAAITADGPGAVQAIFDTQAPEIGSATKTFSASADGQRFLVLTRVADSPAVTVVFNWPAAAAAGAR